MLMFERISSKCLLYAVHVRNSISKLILFPRKFRRIKYDHSFWKKSLIRLMFLSRARLSLSLTTEAPHSGSILRGKGKVFVKSTLVFLLHDQRNKASPQIAKNELSSEVSSASHILSATLDAVRSWWRKRCARCRSSHPRLVTAFGSVRPTLEATDVLFSAYNLKIGSFWNLIQKGLIFL